MSNEKKRAALWAPSLRGDLSPTPAQPAPQGVAVVSKSDAGDAAASYAKLYHEAKARVAELERDGAAIDWLEAQTPSERESDMKELTDEQLDAIAGSSDYFDGYMAIRAASAADRALNAPADRTYEQEHAIKEGHRNKIEDDYFDARPGFSQVHRVSFRGGFDRGWDAAKKDAPADRDVVRQVVTALEWARDGLLWYQDLHPEDHSNADDEIHTLIDGAIAMLAAAPTPAAEPARKPLFAELIASHEGLAEELKAMDAAPPAEQPAPNVLATLRAEVEGWDDTIEYQDDTWVPLDGVLALIDKMGGKV